MEFQALEAGKCYKEFRGMNGSKMYEQDGRLYLVISYDDILDDEIETFRNAPFEVVFKTFGIASLFLFRFSDQHIADAPFDQFSGLITTGSDRWLKGSEIQIEIVICESSTGMLIDKRKNTLPGPFSAELSCILAKRYDQYADTYSFRRFSKKMKEIYDNHLLDQIYELSGEQEIRCVV